MAGVDEQDTQSTRAVAVHSLRPLGFRALQDRVPGLMIDSVADQKRIPASRQCAVNA
jgi:hypothetical protein